jgi:hypothetical protein
MPSADLGGMGRARLSGWIVATVLLVLPAAAHAADTPVSPTAPPASRTTPPPGFKTNATQAINIALRQSAVTRVLHAHPDAVVLPYVYGGWRWEINVFVGQRVKAEVDISYTGRVMRVWTGLAAATDLARGDLLPSFDTPWVWLTFGVLFVVPFVDPRRLRRLLHLDLVVLVSFGVSYALIDHGHPETGVLLVYPPLIYLLIRLLTAGFRPRRPRGRLVPVLPTAALLVGVVALFGARVALNVTSDQVIDIGYASVVGADRVVHKQALYEDNTAHGDTYGPINYIAYVPFEIAFPWHGQWDHLPAAHAAAIAFDLLTLVGLLLLGMRWRAGPEGRRLGLAMAWAWAAFPFTLLGLMESTNDGLVALLLVLALLAFTSAPARGALLGVAAAAKFMPGALVLVFARGRDGDGRKAWIQTVVACAAVFVFAMALYFPKGGFGELWACTLGYQLSRSPDFSLWAITDGFGWTQTALEGLALLLTVAVGVLPGRRTLPQVAALAGAVLIALQLPAGHWFYFYIMWFLPLAFFALFGAYREPVALAAAGTDEEPHHVPASEDASRLALAG